MPFIRHIVTKSSDDGTFKRGDHITYLDDGHILCTEANGWVDSLDVPTAIKGMRSSPDREWLQKRKDKLRAELKILG